MSKMQDIATKVVERATAVHDRLYIVIAITTLSVCGMMGALGLVTLIETLERTELPGWMQGIATLGYDLVFLYWFFRLILRLEGWAIAGDKRVRNAHRQAEVNR